jgi:hypothetical protein
VKFLLWLRGIVGNSPLVTAVIVIFIIILCVLLWRPLHAAEIDLRLGASLKSHDEGPVLGMNVLFPQGGFDLYAGTLLWGTTATTPNNWSWEAGIHACRWKICASLGGAYLQRIDRFNGSHTNFNIELSYLLGQRIRSLDFTHLSNAGTISPNPGRNAALLNIRLQ